MEAYQYKDSGVEWLGKIPKHWKIAKIKNFAKIIPSNVDKKSHGDETPVLLCNYVDVYYNDFISLNLQFMEATANKNELIRYQLKIDDILITKDSEDPFDIAVPALVTEIKEKFLCGYHLSIIRMNDDGFYGAFLFWNLKDKAIASQLYREATGVTRWAIASRHIKNSSFSLPLLKEQKAIADYLDKACTNIDEVLRIKKAQLKKLDSYRKSIIHEAVTKGLDRSIPLKDSGMEWLGKIPITWRVRKIKGVASLKSGDSITALRITPSGDFPVYGGNGLRGFTSKFTHDGFHILIGRQGALCGNINYAKEKFWASEHAVVLKKVQKHSTIWLGELLRSMNLNQYSNAVAQPGLSVEKISNLKIPYPAYKEQQAIADYLDKACSNIDAVKVKIEQQIVTLTAYRKSLIHECVTGKKRVYDGK